MMTDIEQRPFVLDSRFQPSGDQPQAIAELLKGIEEKKRVQVLMGVTGSGKTFTMANVIASLQKPTLVLSHNKPSPRSFTPSSATSFQAMPSITS